MSEMYYKGIDTSNRILDVARQLFYEKGPEKTSMTEIAEKAFVQRTTITYYFKNKDNLLMEIAGDALSNVYRQASEITDDLRLLPLIGQIIVYYLTCTDSKYGRIVSDYYRYYNVFNEQFHANYISILCHLYASLYDGETCDLSDNEKLYFHHYINLAQAVAMIDYSLSHPGEVTYKDMALVDLHNKAQVFGPEAQMRMIPLFNEAVDVFENHPFSKITDFQEKFLQYNG